MILIIGGRAQGKESFARALFDLGTVCNGADCTLQQIDTAILLCHLELLLQRMQAGELQETQETLSTRLLANPNLIVTCTEVGSGVVPLQKQEREYRDLVGAVCIALAEQASQVYRMFCGIATKIKG